MAHDFELRRLTDKLKKLTEDQTRVNHQILKSRRDEQSELDHVRRRFNNQIHNLEAKQNKIAKDMVAHERHLFALQKKMQSDKDDEEEEFQHTLQAHSRQYRKI